LKRLPGKPWGRRSPIEFSGEMIILPDRKNLEMGLVEICGLI
jgi:hypothetical protein